MGSGFTCSVVADKSHRSRLVQHAGSGHPPPSSRRDKFSNNVQYKALVNSFRNSVSFNMFADFIPDDDNAANVNINIIVTKYKYHSYTAFIASPPDNEPQF